MEAFRQELNTLEPEDQVANLLSAMRRELVAARAAIPEFEEALRGVRGELARERDELDRCERRGAMAQRIGDAETARVAEEFAVRHRERIVVLEQKVSAAESELAFQKHEAEEMMRRYREADANRFALLAQLRRSAAQQRMRGNLSEDVGPMSDFGRMEERINDSVNYTDALGELADLDAPPPPPHRPSPEELDRRLQELKRRMGRE